VGEETDRKPWQRQPGEAGRPYAGFCLYRDLGAVRSLSQAAEQYLTLLCSDRAGIHKRQQETYRNHARPEAYRRSILNQFARWSGRFDWVERCRAFDDFASAEADHKAFEARVEAQLQEQKDREDEQKRLLAQARLIRTVGATIISEVGQALAAGEHKQVLTCEECGHVMSAGRLKSLLPQLAKAAIAFDMGAKHERLEADKPTEIVESRLTQAQERAIAEIVRDYIPDEHWDDAVERLGHILAGTNGKVPSGHSDSTG
jgi:hypothetical protein